MLKYATINDREPSKQYAFLVSTQDYLLSWDITISHHLFAQLSLQSTWVQMH